jgi:CubicO group peptidase (beta-lactamase class C family)
MKKAIGILFCTLLLVSILLYAPVFAQQEENKQSINIQEDTRDIDTYLKSMMQTWNLVGLSAGIVTNNQITWDGAYGWADVENKIPVTPDTLFMLASCSKIVTGTALLQLYERGMIDLDDDINKYLSFKVSNPQYPEIPITFRMLLNHTSSIVDDLALYETLYGKGDSDMPLQELVEGYLKPEGKYYKASNYSSHKPGEYWEYCNINFSLIGYLVERVAKMPFDIYCEENIFKPLDMNETSWFLSNLDVSHVAKHYVSDPEHLGKLQPVEHWGWPGYPDGQLRTSVSQFAHFLIMLLNNGEFQSKQILKPETIDTMFARQHLKDLTSPFLPKIDVSLIWQLVELDSKQIFLHTGRGSGISTCAFLQRSDKIGVILLITGEIRAKEPFIEIMAKLLRKAEEII